MKKILFVTFAAFCELASAQIINTIAGTGSASYCGDNGPAISSCIYSPNGLYIDSLGSIFFADEGNNRIRKIDHNGTITTIAGNGNLNSTGDNGPATNASIGYPTDIIFDTHGNFYIADRPNNKVRKVNAQGVISTIVGTGGAGYNGDGISADSAKLNNPGGIAIDKKGNIYVTDGGNHRIRMIDSNGVITTIAGDGTNGYGGDGGSALLAKLNKPYGIAFDPNDNLLFVDMLNHTIRKIDPSGIISTIAGNGSAGYSGDGGPGSQAQLSSPYKIAIDKQKNIYVADYGNSRIRKVDSSGIITTVAGSNTWGFSGDGGSPTLATLNNPRGVAVDILGNLYISDSENMRIRKVSFSNGIFDSDVHSLSLEIYPNPSTGIITLRGRTSLGRVCVYSVTGSLLIEKDFPAAQGILDISQLNSGFYFVAASGKILKVSKL